MIKEISEYLISPQLTNRETILVIDQTAAQIALVVDSEQRLLGTVTDGDLRRGLLRGETLESPVENIMNRKFRALPADCTKNRALRLMREETLRHVPGLDSEGRVIQLFMLEEMIYNLKHNQYTYNSESGYVKESDDMYLEYILFIVYIILCTVLWSELRPREYKNVYSIKLISGEFPNVNQKSKYPIKNSFIGLFKIIINI